MNFFLFYFGGCLSFFLFYFGGGVIRLVIFFLLVGGVGCLAGGNFNILDLNLLYLAPLRFTFLITMAPRACLGKCFVTILISTSGLSVTTAFINGGAGRGST